MLSRFIRCGLSFSRPSLLLVAGCASFSPSDPELPPLAVQIAASEAYRGWFQATAACSGASGDFQAIEWYVVPGVDQFVVDGAPRVGMWQRAGNRSQIVIAGNYAEHEMVVSHEILHHLLGREGHPTDLFVNRCQLTWESWAGRTPGRTAPSPRT